jgi:hypothetical protein
VLSLYAVGGIAQQAFLAVAEGGSLVGPFDAILAYLGSSQGKPNTRHQWA